MPSKEEETVNVKGSESISREVYLLQRITNSQQTSLY